MAAELAAGAFFLVQRGGDARREQHQSVGESAADASSMGSGGFSHEYKKQCEQEENQWRANVNDETETSVWPSIKHDDGGARLESCPSSTTSSSAAGRTWRDVWGNMDADEDESMEDARVLSSTPVETATTGARRQISIANLVSDAPSTYDEYIAQQEDVKPLLTPLAIDNGGIHIKKERLIDTSSIKLASSPPPSPPMASPTSLAMSTIPAAFQRTQSFVSARDFFVPPSLDEPSDGTRLECTICQVSLGNRVYSLKRHLFRHHPHVFRVGDSVRKPGSPTSASQLDLVSPTSTSSTLSSSSVSVKMDSGNEKRKCQCGGHQRDAVVVLASKKSKASSAGHNDGESRGSTALGKRKHPSLRDAAVSASPSGAKNREPVSAANATAKMNEAFVQWLSSDVIPMDAINSKLFRQFVALVNPTFKIPKVLVRTPSGQQKCQTHDCDDSNSDGDGDEHAFIDYKSGKQEQRRQRVMTALCIEGDGAPARVVRDMPIPTPRHDEALIRVLRAGICGTDLAMIRRYKPGYTGALGHEFVGIVEQLGVDFADDAAAHARWIGKRVVAEINIPCDDVRSCETCAAGITSEQMCSDHLRAVHSPEQHNPDTMSLAAIRRRNHCPRRACLGIVGNSGRDVGGAFAEFVAMPVRNLHVVPEGVVDAHAVFAEPLAAACRIVEQGAVRPSDDVAVLGDGKLGLLIAETLHAQRAAKSVALVGKHRDKLALAKHFVTTVYGFQEHQQEGKNQDQDLASATQREQQQQELVDRITKRDGRRFDVCVDATGSPSSLNMALQLLRPGGTVVVKSTVPPSPSLSQSTATNLSHAVDVRALCRNRLRLRGSRCGPLPEALRLLRDRRVDVQKLVGGVYPLARAEQALAHAGTRGALKVQLLMGD